MARRTVTGQEASNKRDEIIAAAVQLYSTRGIAQTSMRKVAAQVGVTDATLYHYFPGKDAMVQAAFESTSFQTEDLERTLAEPAASVAGRLHAVGVAFFDVLARDPAWTRLVIRESLQPSESPAAVNMARLLRELGRRRVELLANALRTDARPASIESTKAENIATHFFHACSGFWIGEGLMADRVPSPARRKAFLDYLVSTIDTSLAVAASKGQSA